MTRALPLLGVVLTAASAPAWADAPTPVVDGITVEVNNGSAAVIRGEDRMALDELGNANSPFDGPAVVDRAARTVTLTRLNQCTAKPEPVTITFDQLRARVAYVAGTKHGQRRERADAATQYAAALAADPTYRPALIRLAITHLEDGDRRAAIAVLAPSLTSAPAATYLEIATTPELSQLLDAPVAPEIAAVRAARPGDVVVNASGMAAGTIGYEPVRKLLAITLKHCMRGQWSQPEECLIGVEIFAASGGPALGWTAIVDYNENFEATVATSAAAAQRALRDLGFVRTRTIAATELATTADGDSRYAIPALDLRVAAQHGQVDVTRGTRVLAHGEAFHHLRNVVYVPAAHTVVMSSIRRGDARCEIVDPTENTVLPIAP